MDALSRTTMRVRNNRKRPTSVSQGADYAVRGDAAAQSRMRKESRSMATVRFVGLDVHAETIVVAVAEAGGEVRTLGTIPNRPEAVRRLVRKLGPADQLRLCYEAGP